MIAKQLTPAWFPLRYHPAHAEAWRTKKRFVNMVAGRSSGKTEISRRKIVTKLAVKKQWSNPIYLYCLPTYAQAKKVAWKPILSLIPDNWIIRNGINVSDMCITTIFGSSLYVVGMDKPHRIEGLHVDGIVADERSDQKHELERTLLPMLTSRSGFYWRIGVPKRAGIGRIAFKAAFDEGAAGLNPDMLSLTWKSSEVLLPEEIDAVKSQMDPQDYDEQFNAVWIDAGGSIYHAFSTANISEDALYDPSLPILVGCDFNVDPMCWCLAHLINGKLYVFDEIMLRSTNTLDSLRFLENKYKSHPEEFKFYGDATGRQRNTKASASDYMQIKNYEGLRRKRVFFPQRNPSVLDRYAAVNLGLSNAKNENRIFIHPNCKRLLTDLQVMSFQEKTNVPEDYSGTDIGHMSDGLGYLVMKVLPIKLERQQAPVIITSG